MVQVHSWIHSCWLGVLVASNGMDVKTPIRLYHETAYGVNIPWLQNALVRDAFIQARCYIHFAEDSSGQDENPDPLHKVSDILEWFSKNLQKA